jgi:hypothetical protein
MKGLWQERGDENDTVPGEGKPKPPPFEFVRYFENLTPASLLDCFPQLLLDFGKIRIHGMDGSHMTFNSLHQFHFTLGLHLELAWKAKINTAERLHHLVHRQD